MKKLKILLLYFVIVNHHSFAQFSANDLITKYNNIGLDEYGFKTGVTLPSADPNHLNIYYGDLSAETLMANGTDGMSYALESLIIMYKTTKDKAYLYEFIRQALELQHWRGNYNEVCNSEIKNNSI